MPGSTRIDPPPHSSFLQSKGLHLDSSCECSGHDTPPESNGSCKASNTYRKIRPVLLFVLLLALLKRQIHSSGFLNLSPSEKVTIKYCPGSARELGSVPVTPRAADSTTRPQASHHSRSQKQIRRQIPKNCLRVYLRDICNRCPAWLRGLHAVPWPPYRHQTECCDTFASLLEEKSPFGACRLLKCTEPID